MMEMMKSIEEALKKYWGFDEFLPLQKHAMECVMSGRDSIVVLPTGGGKSLCYQVPGVTMAGLSIVVSPLISLMKDQVDALTEWGVPAARLDSTMSSQEKSAVFSGILRKELKLVYVSPERIAAEGFVEFLQRAEISSIAVDEAHCVSMWGHDFRPEYRQLSVLKQAFPDIGVHAYTATATERVRRDISGQLHLQNPEILIGSFDRPNLIFRVHPRRNTINQVRSIIDLHSRESGIIYCIRRVDVDQMCDQLKDMGYQRVLPYHAGMEDAQRKENQEKFISEEDRIIVATVAFGMGIDKSNVRFVIHAGMPKSLEHYQQESGRAGRDGLEAECCLFYSASDYATWRRILENSEPQAEKIAVSKLNEMYNYCAGVTCRHAAILEYFGQEPGKENCGACDVCLGDLESMEDSLETSQKILSCVVRLGQRFGADYTASVLAGSKDQRILENGHNELSTYGLLSSSTKRVIRDWIEQLVAQRYVIKGDEYNILRVAPDGRRVLNGEETPTLLTPAKKRPKVAKAVKDSWEGVDRKLFEVLRGLRAGIAKEKSVPAYIVFGDAALRDMARRLPTTLDEFLQVKGVGEKKCRDYGQLFLEVIGEYDNPVQ